MTAYLSDCDWLAEQFDQLTTELEELTPSQWAEQKRYLPPSVSQQPGLYSFDLTPYLREPLDCLGADSQIRHVVLQKGVQVGATSGILENALGYLIDHVRDAPAMLLTADAELAGLRLEHHIIPMLQHSGLGELITSNDEGNKRKTGKTQQRLEWKGGGYAILFGAKNANKLRSSPVKILFRDEVDGYPRVVGKDGDPMRLSEDRTAAFEGGRKLFDTSTPTIKGQSNIESQFQRGDQRYYFVRCLKCGASQRLRWRRTNADTGEVSGIVWEMDGDRLVLGSVRYLCKECGHPHSEEDKRRLFDPESGAEWRPTATPEHPSIRSYHLSALYSFFQTWEALVGKWLQAWDVIANRPRDNGLLQVFYNNVLGEAYEQRGERLRFAIVSTHRRSVYAYGTVPNNWAQRFCGGPILLLVCTVDVQAAFLSVAVHGWCRERRAVLIQYWKFEGDTEQQNDPGTWGKLRDVIEQLEWEADDGKRYRVALTLVDSGYRTERVYSFCSEYEAGVFAIKGHTETGRTATRREFAQFNTPVGVVGYTITVDYYKDRWSAALRHGWDGQGIQPAPSFNAPCDATDDELKELTCEVKRERIEKSTGKRIGFEWHRPNHAPNELWDLLIYADAALDLIAWNYSQGLGLEFTNYAGFYDDCLSKQLFFTK